MNDNVFHVVQHSLKEYKIKVTSTSIKEFLYSDPNYPTLKSICNAFKYWRIEHYPLKLQLYKIAMLDKPFIAHLKNDGGKVAFIKRIDANSVYYLTDLSPKNRTHLN